MGELMPTQIVGLSILCSMILVGIVILIGWFIGRNERKEEKELHDKLTK